MNDLIQVHKAMREAQDAKLLRSVPEQTQSAEEVIEEVNGIVATMMARDEEKKQRCREFLAKLPQTDTCQVHGCEREISFDATWNTSRDFSLKGRHEGHNDGTFFAEYVCPVCERSEKFKHWAQLRIPAR